MATELPDQRLPAGVADEIVRELEGAGPAPSLIVPPRTLGARLRRIVIYVILVAVALLFFTPFFWSVSTSLKTLPESVQGFDLLPDNPTLDAYRNALGEFNFARYTANSAFLAVMVTLCNLLLASLGGYAFARLRFPGRRAAPEHANRRRAGGCSDAT